MYGRAAERGGDPRPAKIPVERRGCRSDIRQRVLIDVPRFAKKAAPFPSRFVRVAQLSSTKLQRVQPSSATINQEVAPDSVEVVASGDRSRNMRMITCDADDSDD